MQALRWLRRKGVTILMYHKFIEDQSLLRSQCAYLQKHYRVIALGHLSKLLREQQPIPSGCVVITIDDGHRSVYQHGYRIFAEFGFPITVYLTTGPLDDGSWLWFDRVAHVFATSRLNTAELPSPNGVPAVDAYSILGKPVVLGNMQQRLALAEHYMELMKPLPQAAFPGCFSRLESCLGVEVPEQAPPEWASLTWEEVKTMSRQGVDFGTHTVTHPILTRIDESAQEYEIVASKSRIEAELDQPVRHFAYPNGQPQDISSAIVEKVRNAGYETAVTTIVGQVFQNDDLFLLKRIATESDTTDYEFRQHVAKFRV